MIIQISEQEFHTIIAALRYYQTGLGNRNTPEGEYWDLATNLDEFVPLGTNGIDRMVDRINVDYADDSTDLIERMTSELEVAAATIRGQMESILFLLKLNTELAEELKHGKTME